MNTVRHSSTVGSFNFCNPAEKQLQIVLETPFGTVSELWNLDVQPDYDSELLPLEVLDMIEQRLKRYVFSTSREKTLQTIATIRENAREVTLMWLAAQASLHQAKAAKAAAKARMFYDEYLDALEVA